MAIKHSAVKRGSVTVAGRCADRGLMLDKKTTNILDKLMSRVWWSVHGRPPQSASNFHTTGKGIDVNTYPHGSERLIDMVIDAMLAEYVEEKEIEDRLEILGPQISISIIEQQFNVTFRDFQSASLEGLLRGKNVILHVPTGSGKSIVFQAASRVLFERGITVAVYPLKSLLIDQQRSAANHGVTAVAINGDVKGSRRRDALKRITTDPDVSMVLTTPETLMASSALRAKLLARGVSLVVIDEAHVYDEWALSFRNAYQRLGRVLPGLGSNVRTLLCSATLTARGAVNAARALKIYDWECVVRRAVRPNLKFANLPRSVPSFLSDALSYNPAQQDAISPGIMFFSWVNSLRLTTDQVGQSLSVNPIVYHGKMSPSNRQAAQAEWILNDRWIVATKAFGMGIDKPNVRTIVHAQLPTSILDYAQEVGRAGRDGLPSICYLSDVDHMGDRVQPLGTAADYLVNVSFPEVADIRKVWTLLKTKMKLGKFYDLSTRKLAEIIYKDCTHKEHELVLKCVSWLTIAGMIERRVLGGEWEFIFPEKPKKLPKGRIAKQLTEFRNFVRGKGYRKNAAYLIDQYELEDNAANLFCAANGKPVTNWRAKLRRWIKAGWVFAESPNDRAKVQRISSSWSDYKTSGAGALLVQARNTTYENLDKMLEVAYAAPADRADMIEKAISLNVEDFAVGLAKLRKDLGIV